MTTSDERAKAREALARSEQAAAGPYVTPTVRAEARRSGVDLNTLTGTGAGGRICLADVRAAADATPAGRLAKANRDLQALRPVAAVAAARRGPKYAANPLVDEVLSEKPEVASRATLERPTLFASGDVPVFTASGVDPAVLMTVPWQARHAVASAPTTAEAFRLLEMYASDPDFAELDFGFAGANGDYRSRVRAWRDSALSDDEFHEEMFGSSEQRLRELQAKGDVMDSLWEKAKAAGKAQRP